MKLSSKEQQKIIKRDLGSKRQIVEELGDELAAAVDAAYAEPDGSTPSVSSASGQPRGAGAAAEEDRDLELVRHQNMDQPPDAPSSLRTAVLSTKRKKVIGEQG